MRTFLKATAVAPALLTTMIALAAPASAQKTPAAVIVTVDNDRILSECNACKSAQAQLQSQAQQLQALQQTLGQPLQTEAEAIQKAAGGKAPDAALQARIQALQTKENSANQQLQQRQQIFQRNRAYVVEQIQQKIGPIVQQVMQAHGANLALEVGATVAAAATLDVTGEVLTQLNTQLPSVSATAPAAPASSGTGGR
jgi:Skp family chaperone for outer membrane proteins